MLKLIENKRIEHTITILNEKNRASILQGAPKCTTVIIELFTRKGKQWVLISAHEGSSDGFPMLVRSVDNI